jgi:hypothetical protein
MLDTHNRFTAKVTGVWSISISKETLQADGWIVRDLADQQNAVT